MDYEPLHPGDKLQKGDEYCTTGEMWKAVPDFMIGDTILDANDATQWRRPISDAPQRKSKRGIWGFRRK